jgi:hypothetical protein
LPEVTGLILALCVRGCFLTATPSPTTSHRQPCPPHTASRSTPTATPRLRTHRRRNAGRYLIQPGHTLIDSVLTHASRTVSSMILHHVVLFRRATLLTMATGFSCRRSRWVGILFDCTALSRAGAKLSFWRAAIDVRCRLAQLWRVALACTPGFNSRAGSRVPNTRSRQRSTAWSPLRARLRQISQRFRPLLPR